MLGLLLYRAATMQGLELDLRVCDEKLDCFFCGSASPYLLLEPFLCRERLRSSKLDDGWPESEKRVFQAALSMVVVKNSR